MDAFTLARLAAELNAFWAGAWLQGVWEDLDGRLFLRLRHRGKNAHLLMSPLRDSPGIGIVQRRGLCPPRPTALAAYLRAHGCGKLLGAECPPYERVVRLQLGGSGDPIFLYLDLVPGRERLYAVDGAGIIRVAGTAGSRVPHLRPGDSYRLPVRPAGRRLPPEVREDELAGWLARGEPLHRHIHGLGPVLAGELAGRDPVESVFPWWQDLLGEYAARGPLWWCGEEIGVVPLHSQGEPPRRCEDPLECAGEWLSSVAAKRRTRSEESLQERQRARFQHKLERRIDKIEADLAALPDPEQARRRAEAFGGSLWQVQAGQARIQVRDLQDPQQSYDIPLDPALTAGQNLDRLYTALARLQRTRDALRARLAQSRRELADGPAPVDRPQATSTEQGNEPYRRYRSSDGWAIWAGRSGVENDRLLRDARPWDVWLHVRDAGGAHVVIRKPGREAKVPERTLWEAAGVAADSCRLREEAWVEVMVAEVNRVRKMKGAAPGRVVVSGDKTLRVKPGAGKATLQRGGGR